MSRCMCPVHLTKFTSVSHKPVVLNTCLHEHCQEAMERELEESGTYRCPLCFTQVFEETISFNQIATTRLLHDLEEKELACDRHPQAIGDFLCATDQKVYCEKCRHAGDCCKDAGDCLDIEIRMLVEGERKAGRVPSQFEQEIRNMGRMSMKAQYALLCRIAEERKEKGRMCAVHDNCKAEGIHQSTLKLGCKKCVSVEPGEYLALDLQRQELIVRVQTFLRKVHCYSLDLPTLQSLRYLHDVSWDGLLPLAVSLSAVSAPGLQSPPTELLCPQCCSPCQSLIKLNCANVDHGICESCTKLMRPVTCPLDGNSFLSSNGGLITACPAPSVSQSIPEVTPTSPAVEENDEEYGTYVTSRTRTIPHWRGTKLPPPTLHGPDFKVLNRFFGVYPPVGVPKREIQDSMSPWNVDQRINQLEAVTILVWSPITLTGMTIACPVSDSARMTVEQVQVLKGDSLSSPLYVSPLNEAVEVSGGAIAVDIRFNRSAVLDPRERYTLALRLRAPGHGILQVYKGNQITAREFLTSESVDLWQFEEPKSADKVMNGENSKSGPILRLFYK